MANALRSAPFLLTLALGSVIALTATARQGSLQATRVACMTSEEREILSHLSIVYLDDGLGGTVKTLDVSGINVRIHNGLGATNGYPLNPASLDPGLTSTNGLGNLIVGYNELGNPSGDNRTGSHNIIFGRGNSFASFGGIAGPLDATVAAASPRSRAGEATSRRGSSGQSAEGATTRQPGPAPRSAPASRTSRTDTAPPSAEAARTRRAVSRVR